MPVLPLFSFSNYALFCLGALSLIMSPGPDFFYVSSRGLAGGRAAGIVSAFGIGTGLLFHTVLAASGLTLLLLASTAAFTVVKWIGAVYLVWMGIKMLRSGNALMATPETQVVDLGSVFRQGVLTNIFNPKVALTFLAFFPQFIHTQGRDAAWQMAILGLTLCVLATLWFCIVGASAGHLGAFLLRRPGVGNFVRIFAGIVLCGLGIRLAFAQRS